MQKCKDNCLICPFILETKEVGSEKFVWRIENKVNCKSYNIVYMLVCTKDRCNQKETRQMRYIGETERTLKDRICEHIGYINTKKYQEPSGEHFTSTGQTKF